MQATPDWQEILKTDRLASKGRLREENDGQILSDRYRAEMKLRQALGITSLPPKVKTMPSDSTENLLNDLDKVKARLLMRIDEQAKELNEQGKVSEARSETEDGLLKLQILSNLHDELQEIIEFDKNNPKNNLGAARSNIRTHLSPRPLRDDAMSSENSLNASVRHLDEKLTLHLERVRERQEADAAWTKEMVSRIEKQNEQAEGRFEKHEKHFEQAEARFERYSELAEARFIKAEERFEARTAEVVTEMRETRRHMVIVSATTIGVTVGAVIAALAVAVTLMSGQLAEQSNWLRYSVDRIEQRIDQNSTSAQSLEPAQQQESEPASSTEADPSQ